MKKFNLNGIVPILLTPFEDNGSIDKSSLYNEVEYCIDAGVDGIGVALGSEIFKLNETERIEILDIVSQSVNDRLPVIINTGAASNKLAIEYSKQAEKQGAYAVMVMPPSFMPVGQEEIFEYFSEISNEISISVVLQDIPQASISPVQPPVFGPPFKLVSGDAFSAPSAVLPKVQEVDNSELNVV